MGCIRCCWLSCSQGWLACLDPTEAQWGSSLSLRMLDGTPVIIITQVNSTTKSLTPRCQMIRWYRRARPSSTFKLSCLSISHQVCVSRLAPTFHPRRLELDWIHLIWLKRKSTWYYSIVLKPAEESSTSSTYEWYIPCLFSPVRRQIGRRDLGSNKQNCVRELMV